jgi:uncharacterized protein (TIGR00251 family)
MSDARNLVTKDGDDVVVAVHVQPGAGRTSVVGRHGDALKVRVAAPPVDDRANEAAIALLAEVLDVPTASVSVVTGARSRVKRLRAALERLELALEAAAEPPGPRQRRQL